MLAGLGNHISTFRLYAAAAAHAVGRRRRLLPDAFGHEERLVFVFGSPRSGTTFFAGAIGEASGFVDLGEVLPLKAQVPELAAVEPAEAAPRIRHVLDRVRLLALARGLRGVEQTPEVAFVARAAALAYPQASLIHVVRDGRDVVCSLLERGWLSARRSGEHDDAGRGYGATARFWVEPDRRREFAQASDATRAAWAWRRYVSASRSAGADVFELHYEELAADPYAAAAAVGARLRIDPELLSEPFSRVHGRSVGRYRRDLSAEQLRDVEREAGDLLRELGYE